MVKERDTIKKALKYAFSTSKIEDMSPTDKEKKQIEKMIKEEKIKTKGSKNNVTIK